MTIFIRLLSRKRSKFKIPPCRAAVLSNQKQQADSWPTKSDECLGFHRSSWFIINKQQHDVRSLQQQTNTATRWDQKLKFEKIFKKKKKERAARVKARVFYGGQKIEQGGPLLHTQVGGFHRRSRKHTRVFFTVISPR